MSVANVVMYEFETRADLEKWADWYKNDGPFPNNEISLFVQTGETSAFGIATYPSEEAREEGGKMRDELVHSSKMSYKVKDVVPLVMALSFGICGWNIILSDLAKNPSI